MSLLVITVARKPMSEGSVAANVLKHGTGALNIEASRIATQDDLNGGAYAKNPKERWDGTENWRFKRGGGRSRLPGDQREGAAAGMYQEGSQIDFEFQQPSGRWPTNLVLQHLPECRCKGIEVWDCAPGCSATHLDEQSGHTISTGGPTSGHNAFGQDSGWNPHRNRPTAIQRPTDAGGASRFFKQVGGQGDE